MLSSGFKTSVSVCACCAAFLSRTRLVRVQRLDSLLKKKKQARLISAPLHNTLPNCIPWHTLRVS
ncbi:hypothetical protein PF005_g12412 [Phytophthora fragariae]|uniref:Uncharacterized protein n=1 Tax=Phytophthora fragariae TaxID=53985 RepID=A0A6A3S4Q6_9STRA|nr:hypothetical protein PF003_g13052 [Phytophthora fragariae]KAE8937029.1 hypothetical protein PF009_g13058 [Phytophthora fragariae]KAE9007728.1 hypothetical protein PF011_g11007 [Phytophthora fragariae]KAE9108511.1 hypothetical protein PF010_g11879 [Phytophthora fragariae]KAE9109842.1 hypothetical protein PF007_g12094 [Phytophthora fragariae]